MDIAKNYLDSAVKRFRRHKDLGEKAMAQVSEENIGPFNERRLEQHRNYREAKSPTSETSNRDFRTRCQPMNA